MRTADAIVAGPSTRPYAVWIAAAILACLFAGCVVLTRGHFVYTLDDPYIHLALARTIAHGGYGINLGQWAAPSSSILWPLLLVPMIDTALATWMPLLINVVCVLTTVWLLERFFRQFCAPAYALVLTLTLAWSVNAFGLVFTGMEHSLQLLLVTVVATALGGLPVRRGLLLTCLIVLPWVRYEDLAVSVPVMVYLCISAKEPRARLSMLMALCLSLAVVAGFSLFLRQHGLGWLPASVVTKQSLFRSASFKIWAHTALLVTGRSAATLVAFVLAVLVVLLTPLRRRSPQLAWLLLASTIPILVFGRCGWFGRYEAHYVAFVAILIAAIVLPLSGPPVTARFAGCFALALLVAHPLLWLPTIQTPLASRSIYEQQYQMGLIVRDYLKQPIAVNDLGLVAWLGHEPVLDLVGLGSKDTLDMRQRDPSDHWIAAAMRAHDTDYAFIYSDWFNNVPRSWIQLAELHLAHQQVAVAGDTVDLYAANAAAAGRLLRALSAYQHASASNAALITIFDP